MEIILRTSKKRSAFASLFGIKGLSIENNLITLDELKDMDTSNIFISVNKNMFNSDLDNLESTLIELSKMSIRGVFFYDMAVLSIVNRLKLNINLIWAQDFLTTNYKTCNYYEKEGIKGVLISNVLTIDEVMNISNNTNLDCYVNIFGWQFMAVSKRNLINNYFDYIKEKNDSNFHYMIEKDVKYKVQEENYGTKIYSNYILNGIRYLKKLEESGIKYIILDDFDIDDFEKVLLIFEKAITFKYDLNTLEDEINKIIRTDLGFFDKKTIYKVKRK